MKPSIAWEACFVVFFSIGVACAGIVLGWAMMAAFDWLGRWLLRHRRRMRARRDYPRARSRWSRR